MTNQSCARDYSYINKILEYTDKELVKKIPVKLIKFLKEHEEKEYNPNIRPDIPLEEQNLPEGTKSMMGVIYRNYFCNEEERKEYDKILAQNQKMHDEEIREKYNPNNIFKNNINNNEKNKTQEEKKNQQIQMIKYDDMSWYKKIITKIKEIFAKIIKKSK